MNLVKIRISPDGKSTVLIVCDQAAFPIPGSQAPTARAARRATKALRLIARQHTYLLSVMRPGDMARFLGRKLTGQPE